MLRDFENWGGPKSWLSLGISLGPWGSRYICLLKMRFFGTANLLGDYFNNRQCAATQVHLTYIAPIYWRTKSSTVARIGKVRKLKHSWNLNWFVVHAANSASIVIWRRGIVPFINWRSVYSSRSGYSGYSGFPVIIHFPLVPTFWSFRLSGSSGFPVVPAFRSFWLFSCRSCHRE